MTVTGVHRSLGQGPIEDGGHVGMERSAIFRGLRNHSKGKILVFLYVRCHQGYSELVSTRYLHLMTGVPLATLRDRLRMWHKWHYLTRRAVDDNGRAVFHYGIAVRGKQYVEDIMPQDVFDQLVDEIHSWQQRPRR